MKLRARFTALFALLAAATILVPRPGLRRGRRAGRRGPRRRALRPRARPPRRRSRRAFAAEARAEFLRAAAASSRAASPTSPRTGRSSTRRTSGRRRRARWRTTLIARRCTRPPADGVGRSRRFSATARRHCSTSRAGSPTGASSAWRCRRRGCGRSSTPTSGRCALAIVGGVPAALPHRRRGLAPLLAADRRADAGGVGHRRGRLRARPARAPAARRCSCSPRRVQRMKDSLATALERAEGERRLTAMVFERLPGRSRRRGRTAPRPRVERALRGDDGRARAGRPRALRPPAGPPALRALRDDRADRRASERHGAAARRPHLEVAVAPLPAGIAAAAVGVLRDVTRLEKTESMRRTFVADVSHELRTPIASIAAAAETLAEGGADQAETAELLGLIRRQSDRMRELIDDLMDLAQIESGAVPLEREEIPLHELLSEVAEDLGPAAREKRVEVRVRATCPWSAVGDRRRLGQLARNLIDNAIKFSPDGGARRRPRLAPGRARGLLGRGPRPRHPEGRARQDLPALLPGRPLALEGPARLGPRPRDRQAHRPAPRRRRRGRGRGRPGQQFHVRFPAVA